MTSDSQPDAREPIPYTAIDRDVWEKYYAYTIITPPDALATMMAMQRRHMEIYENPAREHSDSQTIALDLNLLGDVSARQIHEFFRRVMGYCVEEIMEAVGLFKGKPWKTNFEAPDMKHVKKEIGDAMHFFFEACLAIGLTPEDLFLDCYMAASDENVKRQQGDY